MEYLLLLWPLAGFMYFVIYQAHSFFRHPLDTLKVLAIALLAGPLSWLTLLL